MRELDLGPNEIVSSTKPTTVNVVFEFGGGRFCETVTLSEEPVVINYPGSVFEGSCEVEGNNYLKGFLVVSKEHQK